MSDRKFRLTAESIKFEDQTLYRIKALKNFKVGYTVIKAFELGGFIDKEENLSQDGNCWIDKSSRVFNSKISGDILLQDSIIQNSFMDGKSTIMKSHIYSSILSSTSTLNSNVEYSKLTYSTIEDSLVLHSSVLNSHVEDSLVNESHIQTSVRYSSIYGGIIKNDHDYINIGVIHNSKCSFYKGYNGEIHVKEYRNKITGGFTGSIYDFEKYLKTLKVYDDKVCLILKFVKEYFKGDK